MVYKKHLFKLFLTLLFSFIFLQNSYATSPSEFVQSTVNEASAILGNSDTKKGKVDKLKSIAKKLLILKV